MENSRILILNAFLVVTILLYSCEKKFEKVGWSDFTDPGFPPADRQSMLNDLLLSHTLTGMRYSDIIALLGRPDHEDSTHLTYKIEVDYGFDIDPVYTRDLIMMMDNDSVVTSIEVREWRSGQDR